MATLYLETTDIADFKTVGEIQDILARHGASSVQVEYLAGRPQGVSFLFAVNKVPVPFKLPCRWDSIKKILERNNYRLKKKDGTMEDKARRVAWRQVLAWVKAQFALIECGMVDHIEVFLPYAIVRKDGKESTMSQFIQEAGILSLPAPKSE